MSSRSQTPEIIGMRHQHPDNYYDGLNTVPLQIYIYLEVKNESLCGDRVFADIFNIK
jgi:hypothetical protein